MLFWKRVERERIGVCVFSHLRKACPTNKVVSSSLVYPIIFGFQKLLISWLSVCYSFYHFILSSSHIFLPPHFTNMHACMLPCIFGVTYINFIYIYICWHVFVWLYWLVCVAAGWQLSGWCDIEVDVMLDSWAWPLDYLSRVMCSNLHMYIFISMYTIIFGLNCIIFIHIINYLYFLILYQGMI